MSELDDIMRSPVSRRAFLTRMTAAGLGVAAVSLLAAGCGGGGGSVPPTVAMADPTNFPGIQGASENEVVLNYALTLETLEADLYRQALNLAAGLPITAPLQAQSAYPASPVIGYGGLTANNAAVGYLYLTQYAAVEAAHRDFLRTAISSLGYTPVTPNPNGYTAPFGSDLHSILTLIRLVEETGVRAYLGAAPFLTDLGLIQTASTIYTTEARHSAAMNYVLGLDTGPQPMPGDQKVTPNYPAPNTFEYYLTPTQVLANVKPFFK